MTVRLEESLVLAIDELERQKIDDAARLDAALEILRRKLAKVRATDEQSASGEVAK